MPIHLWMGVDCLPTGSKQALVFAFRKESLSCLRRGCEGAQATPSLAIFTPFSGSKAAKRSVAVRGVRVHRHTCFHGQRAACVHRSRKRRIQLVSHFNAAQSHANDRRRALSHD